MPNDIFVLGLCSGELSVYSYLRRCEDQKTHQCWPSYKNIGSAVCMSENTVSKYVQMLVERGMITTEPTKVTTRKGVTRNGNLLYTVLPPLEVIDQHYQQMMAWSVKPGQAYLSKDGIKQIKSTLTNQIFKQEMYHLYEQKSTSRDELVQEARKVMLELSRQMAQGICEHPDMEQLMGQLAHQLDSVKGKKSYGYLSKPLKKLVDEIVNQTERLPVVHRCYQTWWELQCQVNQFYSGQDQQRPPLSQQKEFRAIKNAVIKEAALGLL